MRLDARVMERERGTSCLLRGVLFRRAVCCVCVCVCVCVFVCMRLPGADSVHMGVFDLQQVCVCVCVCAHNVVQCILSEWDVLEHL